MIKALFARHYKKLIVSISASLGNSALTLFVIANISSMVTTLNSEFNPVDIAVVLVSIFLLCIVNYFSGVLLSDLNTTTVSSIRSSILNKMLTLDYIKREELGAERLYAALTSDVGSLSQFVCLIPSLLYNSAVVVLCIGYMFYLSWTVTSIILLILALAFWVYSFSAKRGYMGYLALRETEDKMFASFDIFMSGSKELSINANRKAHYYYNDAIPSIKKIQEIEHKAMRYWIFSESWLTVALFYMLAAVALLGGSVFHIPPSELVQISMIILFILMPVRLLSQGFATIAQARVALDKIESLDLDIQGDEQFNCVEKKRPFACLSLKNVSYLYPRQDNETSFSVGPVDLSLSKGNIVFVTGGNGSGKTTLIKIMLGLLTPSFGSIEIDGRTLKDDNVEWYRQHFSCIFQDFYLFNDILDSTGSLVSDGDVKTRLHSFDLEKKVTSVSGELSSTKLSQGQRRRLAMIIALFENSPIYVFDEWAADQDTSFKDYFYYELLPTLKQQGKLILAITHDEKYYGCCDRILKMDGGRLANDNQLSSGSESDWQTAVEPA